VIIRTMAAGDLDFAAACTQAEGWQSETREVFDWSLGFDPGGCFVAQSEEGRAGICVATSYRALGFIGELIVLPRHRNRGLGRRLLDRAIDELTRRGARAIFLDGVPAAVPLYERAGFRKVCRSLRFSGLLPPGSTPGAATEATARAGPHVAAGSVPKGAPEVRPAEPEDLPAIAALDREVFGADRGFFLERRLAAHAGLCRVRTHGGRIAGYIMGRGWAEGCQAGPWVQDPDLDEPAGLLMSLAAAGGGRPLVMGVLESNAAAAALARRLPLRERPDPPWRMVRGEMLPASPTRGSAASAAWQVTIGSAAKG
jgi:predicted N-acetyltransferase YhbS